MVGKVLCAFDLDGTILDSKDAILHSAVRTLNTFGVLNVDENEILNSVGLPIGIAFEKYLSGDNLKEAIVQFRSDLATNGSTLTRIFPETMAILEKLQSMGILLAIASNKPAYLSKEVLNQKDLLHYFLAIEGADTSIAKPSPQMLEKLMIQFPGMDFYVMVGDRGEDMKAAKSAGFAAYFVDHGTIQIGTLDPALYDRRLKSLDEIALAIETDWNQSGSR